MGELSTKKRKQPHTTGEAATTTKKSKKIQPEAKDGKQKGKAKSSEFEVVKTSMTLTIAPVFANNLRAGVEEMLDSMVMRYIPALRGVVLSHSNIRFLSHTGTINADCPFVVCPVEFDATIWSPKVGTKLVGKVNLCSPDHVSLLLHRTFNVSIPRHHIPKDEWEFEYGPAENDPEFGPEAGEEEGEPGEEENPTPEQNEQKANEGGGSYVHHLTTEKLGGPEGFLEFTVIGLTIANEMLSVIGSIQPDPFSARHVPETKPARALTSEADASEVQMHFDDDEEDEDEEEEEDSEDDDDMDSDGDTFRRLGKMSDKAATAQAKARRKEEKAARAEKEKKKKRKAEKQEEKKSKRTKT